MYYFAMLIEVVTAGFTSKIIEKVTFEQRFIEKVVSEEKLKEDKKHPPTTKTPKRSVPDVSGEWTEGDR